MAAQTKITFLGTGTSTGVPVIGCHCEVCLSKDPKNARTRSALLLESSGTTLLIDTGPDLRRQALREGLSEADAVLYTHGHADHTAGFDEIRAFCWRRDERLPVYGSADTIEILTRMFPWAFDQSYQGRGYVRADAHLFTSQPFQIGDFTITPFPVTHASIQTHGFHIALPSGKALCYASDVKEIPSSSFPLLRGCALHILDALRFDPHPSHLTISEAVSLSQLLGSRETYLTHLSHEVDHQRVNGTLPETVHLSYDGLTLTL